MQDIESYSDEELRCPLDAALTCFDDYWSLDSRSIPNVFGIYFIFSAPVSCVEPEVFNLLYIGSSGNCRDRLHKHGSNSENDCLRTILTSHKNLFCCNVAEYADEQMERVEAALIFNLSALGILDPTYNNDYMRKFPFGPTEVWIENPLIVNSPPVLSACPNWDIGKWRLQRQRRRRRQY